jgi:hypothetical protein
MIRVIAAAITLSTLSLFASAPAQAEAVSFTLVNGTSRTLEEFYASPPSTDDWEADILGVDVLNPGESVEITINDGREDCQYDFKGRFGCRQRCRTRRAHSIEGECVRWRQLRVHGITRTCHVHIGAIVVLLLPLLLTEVVGYGLVLATAAVGECMTTVPTRRLQGLVSNETSDRFSVCHIL